MNDLVTELRTYAAQLMRQWQSQRFAGEGTAIRVLGPENLHALLSDAADEIERLRSKEVERNGG